MNIQECKDKTICCVILNYNDSETTKAEYDITQTSKWLEQFYLRNSK